MFCFIRPIVEIESTSIETISEYSTIETFLFFLTFNELCIKYCLVAEVPDCKFNIQ